MMPIKRGDLEEFEFFLSAHEDEIFCFILKLVGVRQDAEDLTQETFIKFYKNLSRLDYERSPRALLYAIARSTTYDWFRKRKRGLVNSVSFEDILLAEDMGDSAHGMRDDAEMTHLQIDLDRALKKIKPLYAHVLDLFYFKGCSYEEIASLLNLPLNTVKTNISRARSALKREFV